MAEKDLPVQQWCLEKLFTVFIGTFSGPLLFHCNYDIKEIYFLYIIFRVTSMVV